MHLTTTTRALAAAGALAVVADAATTVAFIQAGTGTEANPLVAASIAAIGLVPALGLWSLARIAAIFGIARISRRLPLGGGFLLVGVTAWSWLIVANNLGLVQLT